MLGRPTTWQRAGSNPQPAQHGSSAPLLPQAAAVGEILPSSLLPQKEVRVCLVVAHVMGGVDFPHCFCSGSGLPVQ